MIDVIKAHAYGNDFLFIPDDQAHGQDGPVLARTLCDRHTGIGGDGLAFYRRTPAGAAMRLLNADGSVAEVSGNGVRCLAAILVREHARDTVVIQTEAGEKRLTLMTAASGRYAFRAAMGQPEQIRSLELEAAGQLVSVIALSVGNPQCVVLGGGLTESRLHTLGPALATHPTFPAGTNVELVEIETPQRIHILIWERGVGPTASSGTGSCAAAVAAISQAKISRDVVVVAPGGSQRVEWHDDGLYLTGWAEVTFEGQWVRD